VRVFIDVFSVMAAYFDCNKRIYLECAGAFKRYLLNVPARSN